MQNNQTVRSIITIHQLGINIVLVGFRGWVYTVFIHLLSVRRGGCSVGIRDTSL